MVALVLLLPAGEDGQCVGSGGGEDGSARWLAMKQYGWWVWVMVVVVGMQLGKCGGGGGGGKC